MNKTMPPQAHTTSYYAASVNTVTDYPALQGNHSADVCVVGAGFTGVSTALHLAERGYRVIVVEANRVGWGASGRNGGQLIGGIAGEAAIAKSAGRDREELFSELRWVGHDIVRERIKTYGIECDLKDGYLDVAIKPSHVRDLESDYERMRTSGFKHEIALLTQQQTADLIGTDAYIGSLLNMYNGHLHPLNLCIGEAQAAESLGVQIFEGSAVTSIDRNQTPRVRTALGSVTADAVVLAGNAYHHLEKRLRGIMFPVNSYIIGTEPLSADLVSEINPRDLAVCDPNFVLEYYRLSADKRMLFGGRFNYFGHDPKVIATKHRKKLARLYPQLADIRIDYAWGGTIGVPLNRVPQMGRIAPQIFYSQGYSGHGVNVTHLAGRIMADAVAGTMEQFDLFANVKPKTLPGAYRFSRPMVSLGILYYQIKDRL